MSMHSDDTIAALSTPVGYSGIGIVRLSGKDALNIADAIFLSPKGKKIRATPSHRILFGHIIVPGGKEIIDEVLVSVMKSPNTYTREDMVEINCHGGPVPTRRILELLLKKGARLAEPGEFTRRAFLNGRIDLAQAEAVTDIINALTVQGQRTAMQQLKGALSARIEKIKDQLIELTAYVEAHIDFPEEEIEAITLNAMEKMAEAALQSLKDLIAGSRYGIILREGLKTAIIGRPNVGKSSLLNAMLEQDRAIVTEVPGTTRDVIEEYLNVQGLPVKIMDTAGIRTVKSCAEKEGVKRSLALMENADLVLLVLDGSEALHATDRKLIKKSEAGNTIIVINKCDLPDKLSLKGRHAVRISAKEKKGLDQLKDAIVRMVTEGSAPQGTDVVTNVRHLHALEKACASLESFLSGVPVSTPPEFLAVELRESLDAVGEILGITTPDEILDRIFSNFCIGK